MRDGLSQMYLKTCISPDLERSDFDRQSFQYTWLNIYLLFRSIRESLSFAQAYSTWPSLSSFDKSKRVYSITCWRLRYLISFIPPVWLQSIPISLCKTATPQEAVTHCLVHLLHTWYVVRCRCSGEFIPGGSQLPEAGDNLQEICVMEVVKIRLITPG